MQIDAHLLILVSLILICLYIFYCYTQDPKNMSQSDKLFFIQRIGELLKQNKISPQDHKKFSKMLHKEDEAMVKDSLKYPYTRLPSRIIKQYKDSGFYESGAFGNATNYFEDSEKIIGNIILDPSIQNMQMPAFPIYEKSSATNRDKYFYYIIDTRLSNNYKIKIPMNTIKVNGRKKDNVNQVGIDQLMSNDTIEILDFNFQPGTIFNVKLYPKQSGLYYNPDVGEIGVSGYTNY